MLHTRRLIYRAAFFYGSRFDWTKEREAWIEALKADQNPFTSAVLEGQ